MRLEFCQRSAVLIVSLCAINYPTSLMAHYINETNHYLKSAKSLWEHEIRPEKYRKTLEFILLFPHFYVL